MKILNKISDGVNKVVSGVAIVLFVIMICACVLQVFFRFVLHNSLSWSEELARYCFIWMHLCGASLLLQNREHATVTAILDLIKGKVRRVWDLFIELVIMVDGLALVIYGAKLVSSTWGNPSPAMSLNMGILNLAAPISGALLMLQALVMMATEITALAGKDGSAAAEGGEAK